jgi:hypothetical protein
MKQIIRSNRLPMPRLYLTDLAYDNLCLQTYKQKYTLYPPIPTDQRINTRCRGLSAYLNDLSLQTFVDNRPQCYVEPIHLLIEECRLPDWRKEAEPAKPRHIRISDAAIHNYVLIAQSFAMMNKFYTANGLVSTCLEAIGTNWLVPEQQPICSHPPKPRRRHTTEFDWL